MHVSSLRDPRATRLATALADPALAASLSRFVRARLPESDAEDVVQATLAAALDAGDPPADGEDLVRWLFGICRHKLVDWYRRMRREVPSDLQADDGAAAAVAESAPTGALDLMRWARRELPEGDEHAQTLEWMLREGAGEKLESIAAEANVPAPRVRQRVSRLRRYFKARWAAQLAALAALMLVALALGFALRKKEQPIAPLPAPSLEPQPAPVPTAPPEPAPLAPALGPDASPPPAPSASAAPSAPSAKTVSTAPAPPGKVKPRPTKVTSAPVDPTGLPTPSPAPASSGDSLGSGTTR